MSFCKWWREVETEGGREYEFCKAVRRKCACAGEYYQCNNHSFYNVPKHRLQELRAKMSVDRTTAAVESFREVENG